MSNYKFDYKTLYSKTNDGLDILLYYLKGCKGIHKAIDNPKEAFHYRENDDTASAYLIPPDKTIKSGDACYWRMKDWGDDFYTPMSLAMQHEGLDFYPCLKKLYELFSLVKNGEYFRPKIEFTTLEDNDKRDIGYFDIKFSDSKKCDFKIVGRFLTKEICDQYYFYPVEFYEKVFIKKDTNKKTLLRVESTDSYPIFAYSPDETWAKLYAPFDRERKHSYLGSKPVRYIHGYNQIIELYKNQIQKLEKNLKDAQKKGDDILSTTLSIEIANYNVGKVFIASGGSDGLNIASLGYNVIWFNSEAEQITYDELQELVKVSAGVYNVPDVDAPGLKYAYEVAEANWTLKTVFIPKEKLQNNGKDFRDWMKFYNNANFESVKFQFNNLVNGALQCKFFEKVGKKYNIKPSYLHFFLKVKGFHIYTPEKHYTDKLSEQELIWVQVTNNRVVQVFPNQIRKFCERYLIQKGQPVEVIDLIKSSVQFNEKNLVNLDEITLETKNYGYDFQCFFFKNLFAKVTADEISLQPYKNYENHVLETDVLNHNISVEKPFFKHFINEQGKNCIEILEKDCDYLNFLINTSRVFWRDELELPYNETDNENKDKYYSENRFNLLGPNISAEKHQIQVEHLLNKIYCIGYLLHKQKRSSYAKALFTMDDRPKDSETEANGRNGKTLFYTGIDQLLVNRFYIDGKNKNLNSDKHALHGLSKNNNYIYIEDLDQFADLEFFFNWITGSIIVNPKNSKPYEIKFFDAPKLAFSSNYGVPKASSSIFGRLLFMSFSDHYHIKNENYLEERKVNSDFNGVDLFSEMWDSKKWNKHFNFLLQCLQFYLQNLNTEFKAPALNIEINNAKASMGDTFIEWADSYFCFSQYVDVEVQNTDGTFTVKELVKGTLNEYVLREEMQAAYQKKDGKKTSKNFKESLKKYCLLKGWVLNPKDKQQSDGRIKLAVMKDGKRQILEHFFIEAKADNKENVIENNNEVDTDLPF